MHEALEAWNAGSADWIEDWDKVGERGRAAFAALSWRVQDSWVEAFVGSEIGDWVGDRRSGTGTIVRWRISPSDHE